MVATTSYPQRQLGRNGPTVAKLGFGTMGKLTLADISRYRTDSCKVSERSTDKRPQVKRLL